MPFLKRSSAAKDSLKMNQGNRVRPQGHPSKKRLLLLAAALFLIAVGSSLFYIQKKINQYDVVVVGAGPGGIAASIQAARMGAHVALLENTDWVGGQMTAAGVGTMDEGSLTVRDSGIYKEFVQQVMTYYKNQNKSVDTCYFGANSLCIDPQVGQTILKQMLGQESSHLQLFTGTSVSSVLKQGNTVTGVVANGKRFSSKVLIDADEYGDILAQSGAPYRLGSGTSANPNPDACVQDITYTAIIKQYPNGVPQQLQFTKQPPGYNQSLVKHFASFLSQNGFDHFTLPRNPMSFASYIAYRGLPDTHSSGNYDVFQKNGHTITRTTLNFGNDFPVSGSLSSKFLSDPTSRLKSVCEAKQLTLQLIYYIQHDLGESDWSIANDEGYDTSYNQQQHCANLNGYEGFENQMPQEPYVREGYRLIGTETLTGNALQYSWKDKSNIPKPADSIAVGYYPMDLHGCRNQLESNLDSPDDIKTTYAGGPFEVPLGVLIPESMDGLLAAEKNISASRDTNGAIREQPIAMDIGQAAGALAALAAKHNTQPRNVSASEVQATLHAAHAVTSVSTN